jgi:pimeloyl-ACP methyl ester carboxylesterase
MPTVHRVPQRFVESADGVRLSVYEEGNPGGPTVALAHGFPDSHALWDGVAPRLTERFRVIRYDNSGVGQSSVPKGVSAFTMSRFADDFAAMTAELSPGALARVLAHDGARWVCAAQPGRQHPRRADPSL